MNQRLQRKCLIASAGLHSLLVLILFVGPAFIGPKPSLPDNLPLLDFIPLKTVDELVSGGGNPNGSLPAPPPPAPERPKPAPPAPAPPETRPTPEPPQPDTAQKDDPEPSLEPAPKKARKPEISLKPIVRKRNTEAEAKARAEAQAREEARAWEDSKRRLASQFSRAAANIESGISSGTSIELKGPGGGGIPYANFLQAVKSVYTRAWVVPDGIADDDAVVQTSVTIARDGSVKSARVTRSSGSPGVDQSVKRTLDRVKFAAPLPDSAKENERTVEINFSVRAKRLLG